MSTIRRRDGGNEKREKSLALGAVLGFLILAGPSMTAATAAPKAGSGPATQHAGVSRCSVHHEPFMEAGVAHGRMRVMNDGQPCGFAFQFGMKFDPSSWRTAVEPRHGRLHFDGPRVEYLPTPGYIGADTFTVTAFGMNPMNRSAKAVRSGQFAIDVDVQPAPR